MRLCAFAVDIPFNSRIIYINIMSECADLEISLHRTPATDEQGEYAVEFRFNQPGSEVEIRQDPGEPALVKFDLAGLSALAPAARGSALSQALFQGAVGEAFAKARAAADALDLPLRLRFLVGASAPELNGVAWETLSDPDGNGPLCMSQRLLFSRYLGSADWRTVKLRPKSELRALALVASPANLADFNLPALDVQKEIARVRAGMNGIQMDALPEVNEAQPPGASETRLAEEKRASLPALLARLHDAPYDILVIVCHAARRPGGDVFYLEDEQGRVSATPGSELAAALYGLETRPRLVVLLACESAAAGGDDALVALGPRLAEIGIPAVVAMQSVISFETAGRFLPAFFADLQRQGAVDRAFATARAEVRDRPDAWAPVLFMRLKTGRLWYEVGFSEPRAGSDVWPRLILRLKTYADRPLGPGPVTPVLGHGLIEPLVGSLHEVALRWAEAHHYPLSPSDRDSLPQVAQFLSVDQDEQFPYENLAESLRQEVVRRFPDLFPGGAAGVTLKELFTRAGKARRAEPLEPHRVLAGLGLPVYLTANVDSLLEDALAEAGKQPEVVLCPWFPDSDQVETVYDREKYIPTPDRPLVYHLFGKLDTIESIVLTEDDYFDYLMGVSRNSERIPNDVQRVLADSTLMFIGFQLQDWNFRAMLRSILSLSQESRRRGPTHISAQIEPDENRILEPDGARHYIEKYFSQDARVSLYWGSVEDFIRELRDRWLGGGA